MEKKRDMRNGLLGLMVVALLVMTVGYAALSQNLKVDATASVADAKWKVRITDIEFDETASTVSTDATEQSLNPAEAVQNDGSTGAKFDVNLGAPGDKAVYVVTVTNLGTIAAELNQITDLTSINNAEPTDIKFTVTEAEDNNPILAANGTHKYIVTVEWLATSESVPEVTEKTVTINFDYQQA